MCDHLRHHTQAHRLGEVPFESMQSTFLYWALCQNSKRPKPSWQHKTTQNSLQHHCIGSEKGAPLSQSEVVLLVFMWKHTQHCELLLREPKVSNQCPALCSSRLWWRRCQMKAPSLWLAQMTTHSVILYMGDFAATLLNSQNATRKHLPRGRSVHDIHRKWLTCRAWRSGLRTQQKRPTCTFSSEKNLCSRVKIPGWRDIAVHRQH